MKDRMVYLDLYLGGNKTIRLDDSDTDAEKQAIIRFMKEEVIPLLHEKENIMIEDVYCQ